MEFKDLKALVQKIVRESTDAKLNLGETLSLGALATQDTITVSQISDYVEPQVYERGQEEQSGDGVQTDFTIPHSLSDTPLMWLVTPASADAKGEWYATADATNITVHYTTAPANGTNNLKWNWMAAAPIPS